MGHASLLSRRMGKELSVKKSSRFHIANEECGHCYLCDGVVRGVDGLQALVSRDAHPHVGCLDHAHVIGSIAHGQGDGLHLSLHQVHHLRLLQRRHPGRGKQYQSSLRPCTLAIP